MSVLKKPANIVDVTYAQTGNSVNTDQLGMREMQQRVFVERAAQYLLLKAPPASGKSRALMFIALDKLYNQDRKKVIVAVPERSIGGSFASTELTRNGFWADWEVEPRNNLCTPGGPAGKVQHFIDFLAGPDAVLVCTHATLRFAHEKLPASAFNGAVLAIDEFHHVSADTASSRLGELLKGVMTESDAHIVAMTGSYFRGDTVPVLLPEDEAKFTPVTFNYYDQLNGYEHLKSLGIGHHFYQGRYTNAIHEILDPDKKTLIHIPNVNSGESTKDKVEEVGFILDAIGEIVSQEESGILNVRSEDGTILRVADLVDDSDQLKRAETLHYLSTIASKDRNAVDIIIALGMAKEGFDWPFCEHALTVGYRASLTEVIQIIGRVTRDSPGKPHAQFTNLLAQPDATTDDVKLSVNNMLKAITASLLMEQVLAPNFTFKAKINDDDKPKPGELKVKGFKEPTSERVKQIVATDLNDLKATILQDETFAKAAAGNLDAEVANKVLIPKIIRDRYPDLNETQVEELRQQVVVDSVIKSGEVREVGDKRFIRMADKFVNIDDLDINLIDKVNPFQRAFEVLSKSVTPQVLRIIQDTITATRIEVTDEEARLLWPKVQQFAKVKGRKPDIRSDDPTEKRYAEVLLFLQKKKREHEAQKRTIQA
ncbi:MULTISPECIES: DEAD/DEAH box helicase [Rhodococcus]|uniref:DEAD/DEAH box helicase n=1 Tax=Rhodococcus TaxID=1827 RepID=UPI001878927F|nr:MULTISPECIES: DEAD/DEAH box helicase family protein [Rhodococcus]MDI9960795.1 DEAD/DEAH box helicase family protein [Rhodococcus sp. IEGM 1237]MDI9966803.1 DEAD/DEAH box helicase family protein [Rhodococcus sp. IEGM 1251]MDV8129271.1 DEAD/DEAH box helicase family protein [Rhodococcus sp. IEGM 1304]QOS60647.1 ATP-dependent helicase [Rhodococcus qingshengii]